MSSLTTTAAKAKENAEHVLFYFPSMKHIATKISTTTKKDIKLGECNFNHFADGWPDLLIKDANALSSYESVTFLGDFHSHETIFEQLAVIYALPRHRCKNFQIVIPFFPTGTMERIDHVGQVATAMTFARCLSSTPPCASGPANIIILDIHALQEQFYFSDNVLVQLESCAGLLRKKLSMMEGECTFNWLRPTAHLTRNQISLRVR